jgi:hypothetical protein
MYRLFLSWLPYLKRPLGLALLMAVVAVGIGGYLGLPWYGLGVVMVLGFLTPFWRLAVALWRFGFNTRRFETTSLDRVFVHYASDVPGDMDPRDVIHWANEALDRFSKQFGFDLKRRLVVYLFSNSASLGRIFKRPSGGLALTGGDAIALSPPVGSGGDLHEVLLHEIAHLYSARLGSIDPPLKGEGLATWLMETVDGKPIDFYALVTILCDRYMFLTWLSVPAMFTFDLRNYAVAGSFTGFLIRRFGWSSYRNFFQRAGSADFEKTFAEFFQISLLKSEQQWRDELLARRSEFEPDLSRLVAERNVEAAYEAGQIFRCLQEIETVINSGHASGKIHWYAAAIQMYLGHYSDAFSQLQQAIAFDDSWVRSYLSSGYLMLGNLHDLLGQRDEAVTAYQKSLVEPDYWSWSPESIHALARRYLSRPYSERDFERSLRQYTVAQGRKPGGRSGR